MDAVWYYHHDHNKDRRCVCSTCMGKWLDLCCNFRVQYFAYSTKQLLTCKAAAVAQAVCCSFAACLCLVC